MYLLRVLSGSLDCLLPAVERNAKSLISKALFREREEQYGRSFSKSIKSLPRGEI